ncbi:hypothetical protein [Mesorhizobium sp. WSM4906]|uniref:hypothetical protein n=1 Tax=Mesorhizobium sp. WSM4906 TaxID=3038546 RepID=UPI00241677E3|nr:hypothetical protein [Mesorhizobium sp. WSM4906]WFP77086.1 hypothetical protein QAZ22_04345 [Mesorhizobium sp. WSM4906]
MRTRENLRWSLPRRLRDDGWWLVEPQRLRPMPIVLPFVARSQFRPENRLTLFPELL